MNRLAAAVAVAALALGACGGDDETSEPIGSEPAVAEPTVPGAPATEPGATAPGASSDGSTPPRTEPATTATSTQAATHATTQPGGAPITVEHVYGTTELAAAPERIVSLDMQWTDVLTALGHPPIAAVIDPSQGGWLPWQQSEGIEPIEIGADNTVPYERIAALQPDLIVGSWGIVDQAMYDTLAAIAPTIGLLGDRQVDPWEDMATAAAHIFGEPDAAAALVAAADRAAADLLAELPGLAGKHYALANYVPGDQIYVVADPDDGASQLFAKLEMSIDPELLALDDSGFGRVGLSLEQIDQLDSDLLLILTNGVDTSEIPGFDRLPAVQSGAYSVLEYAPVVGLNTPTPLSIPYSLGYIRDALEAVAAG